VHNMHEKSHPMKPTQQRTEEGENLWAEPRPHLVIHGANLETMARYAYNEQRHDKCVPYVPASRVTALEQENAELIAELLKWWKGFRPIGWSEDEHRKNPTVNASNDRVARLAKFVAGLKAIEGK
jgi:hypothetical protein